MTKLHSSEMSLNLDYATLWFRHPAEVLQRIWIILIYHLHPVHQIIWADWITHLVGRSNRTQVTRFGWCIGNIRSDSRPRGAGDSWFVTRSRGVSSGTCGRCSTWHVWWGLICRYVPYALINQARFVCDVKVRPVKPHAPLIQEIPVAETNEPKAIKNELRQTIGQTIADTTSDSIKTGAEKRFTNPTVGMIIKRNQCHVRYRGLAQIFRL